MKKELSDLLEILDLKQIEVNMFQGVSPAEGWQRVYGGQVIGQPFASTESDARRAGVPENIITLTGTYAFDNGFAINGSIVDVDEAFSGYTKAVRLPSYTLVNLGVLYETENWAFSVMGKNLTDERYFRANFPNLFGGTIVLPELPRSVQASAAYRF